MNLHDVVKLKIGDRVRCRLNGASEYKKYYTGTINHILTRPHTPEQDPVVTITINRDDMQISQWHVTVHKNNVHLISLIYFEWNEEEN